MLKRNVTILLMLLLVPCFMMGQALKVSNKVHKVVGTENTNVSANYNKTAKLLGTPVGESIGLTTNYDSWTNCIVRDQIIWAGGVKLANMVRPYPNLTGAAGTRHIVFSQKDSVTGVWSNISVFGGAAGWPDIDISRTGSNLGTIGIVGHSPNRLAVWDGSAFQVSTFAPATDPSFQFVGDKIFLGTSGNVSRDQFQMYSSPDGTTFVNWDSISAFKSNLFWQANGSIEMGISKSADETKVVYYGVNAGSATLLYDAFNGFPIDSCDNFWTLTSTNAGTNWSSADIEFDGVKGILANYPNYAPLVRDLAQVDVAVTNSGIVHAVAAGFGYNFGTPDTTYMFPIIYFNTSTAKWIEVSSPAIDTIQSLYTYSSGRHLGNSYPSVSASEDGKLIYICWTGPQMTGTSVDTASDGSGIPFNWRDLYHCWSIDGGKTFTTPILLSSDKTTSEEVAQAPQLLRFDPVQKKYVADIVYLAHLGSGSFIQDATTEYNDPIMYTAFTIPDVPTGVNDGNQVVRSFNLEQNYPNPFNPTTSINYTLTEKSNVSLKVYDMLGREVANLVNASQVAGPQHVTFDASKLASGVYVYTLRANSNVMSKKMMLMK